MDKDLARSQRLPVISCDDMLCTNKYVNDLQHYHNQLIRACNQPMKKCDCKSPPVSACQVGHMNIQ